MYQNQWNLGSTLNMLEKVSTLISVGAQWDHGSSIHQQQHEQDTLDFTSFLTLWKGTCATETRFAGSAGPLLQGPIQWALFVNDNYKVRSNLALSVGLRWDFDGRSRRSMAG